MDCLLLIGRKSQLQALRRREEEIETRLKNVICKLIKTMHLCYKVAAETILVYRVEEKSATNPKSNIFLKAF